MGKRTITEGIFDFGTDWASFRSCYEWARKHYAWRGWTFSDIRSHVFDRYQHGLNRWGFGRLFQMYVWDLYQVYVQECCGVANDNEARFGIGPPQGRPSTRTAEMMIRADRWMKLARYPILKWHPFWRVPRIIQISGREGLKAFYQGRR